MVPKGCSCICQHSSQCFAHLGVNVKARRKAKRRKVQGRQERASQPGERVPTGSQGPCASGLTLNQNQHAILLSPVQPAQVASLYGAATCRRGTGNRQWGHISGHSHLRGLHSTVGARGRVRKAGPKTHQHAQGRQRHHLRAGERQPANNSARTVQPMPSESRKWS